ncbi:hypothetical protein A2803_00460 [Candidatus Woesebacteria bacterium RIFCSPHIGHO2_01_FULL_44_21]|uniref:Uncharacterized protein n=1 Tax=Candidatus Woesebacteria bacterium RIFCSPHIGHO2_01_FULL_44_21 TaxID=1802503 RepID=A0A1F7YY10_9BACT|nr:MAG: hypothetical protein A2803_00460 [Candidatus Woesebacteria bacterium RIFCSPHIGHO2_01_FULL_44_21]OGM68947.1 MAG: hypothetical protein A2897_02235 [Candidatus Woesebacteria bacterium RIFCSPLOWO2_01_FULL_44_24b]
MPGVEQAKQTDIDEARRIISENRGIKESALLLINSDLPFEVIVNALREQGKDVLLKTETQTAYSISVFDRVNNVEEYSILLDESNPVVEFRHLSAFDLADPRDSLTDE